MGNRPGFWATSCGSSRRAGRQAARPPFVVTVVPDGDAVAVGVHDSPPLRYASPIASMASASASSDDGKRCP